MFLPGLFFHLNGRFQKNGGKQAGITCRRKKCTYSGGLDLGFFVQNHGHFSRFLTCCFEKKMYNSIRDLGERQRHRRLPVHRSQGKCTAERNKQAVRESAGRRGTEDGPADKMDREADGSPPPLLRQKGGKNNVLRLSSDDSDHPAVDESFRSDERTSSHAAGRRRTDCWCAGRPELP